MLTLAFDTATSFTTVALVRDDSVLGERTTVAASVLSDADELMRVAGVRPGELSRVVVGTGPGSFTGIRIGLAAARGLAFALSVPAAGVSTLDALAAGGDGVLPIIDAKRREVFTLLGGPRCVAPHELALRQGTICVGDGALRYRTLLEEKGAVVPEDGSPLHLPWARHHAALAREFVDAERVAPIYLRIPDAEARGGS